nr:putative ribonuclease H-like domain-containing protein [Tanacetum cinerariifolium]
MEDMFHLVGIQKVMCDKKNDVLFTDTECVILSSDFKLPNENHVLLKVPRENNMYNVDLKNVVPSGDLTCLFAKATLDKYNLWHRRLGHINFKTMNKLVKGKIMKEAESAQQYVLLPLWSTGSQNPQNSDTDATFDVKDNETKIYVSPSSSDKPKKHDEKSKREAKGKSLVYFSTGVRDLSDEFEEFSVNSTNRVNATSTPITVVGQNSTNSTNSVNAAGPSDNVVSSNFEIGGKSSFVDPSQYPDDPDMPALKDIIYSDDDEDVGAEADFSNLEISITVSPIPTTRVHKDHLVTQIIGKVGKETVSTQQYVLLPIWSTGLKDPQNIDVDVAFDIKKIESEVYVSPSSSDKTKKHDEQTKEKLKARVMVNAAIVLVTAIRPNLTNSTNSFNAASPSDNVVNMPGLEDIVYSDDKEDVGAEADFSNLETSIIGNTQEEGIDYEEFFAPVARIEAIWLFLTYASFMGFLVCQIDVKSAFLYGTVEEEVYASQPPGFKDPDYPDKVYKVVKALYGLHQAPRAWYVTLANYLLENGFQRGKIDQTLFIKKQKGDILLVQVYVNDIIFGSTNKELCKAFEKLIKDKFQMSSMGELTFFLGLQYMSAKRTAWNEFSSFIASAVICLAIVMINAQVDDLSSYNTKYTSPALTQKVFANMRRIEEDENANKVHTAPSLPTPATTSPPQQEPVPLFNTPRFSRSGLYNMGVNS